MIDPNLPPPREAEFTAMRDAIQKNIDRQGAVENLTIVAAGSLFAASTSLPVATFVYPLLAVFLAARWAVLAKEITDTGDYIFHKYEQDALGWEHHARLSQKQGGFVTNFLGPLSACLFIFTEIVAVIWSVIKVFMAPNAVEWVLLVFDVIAIFFTAIILVQVLRELRRIGRVEIILPRWLSWLQSFLEPNAGVAKAPPQGATATSPATPPATPASQAPSEGAMEDDLRRE